LQVELGAEGSAADSRRCGVQRCTQCGRRKNRENADAFQWISSWSHNLNLPQSVRDARQSVVLIGLRAAMKHSKDVVPGVVHVILALACRAGPGGGEPEPVAKIDKSQPARLDQILNTRIGIGGRGREDVGRTYCCGTCRDLSEPDLGSLEELIFLRGVVGDV